MALCHTISLLTTYTDHQYFATSDLLISLTHNKTGKEVGGENLVFGNHGRNSLCDIQ